MFLYKNVIYLFICRINIFNLGAQQIMLWTDLFYMIVITTFTGSVLTVAWLITSYLLDKTGYLNMSYRLGKVVVLFWIIPVMYYAIRMIDRLRFVWNGYAFDTSPLIINVTRAVAIVWITGLAVAAAILTLFVAMSSVMVAGAATTVTETSVTVAEVTADEKRELQVLETEYYEAADYEDSAVTDMYEEDVNPDEIMPCASNGTISWDVYAGVRRSTSSFHASSGQRIVLSVFSVEPFRSVRAGIIQPDGSKRYIIANGNDSHIFELTMSGSYRIYIQNETTESVHVEGAYSTH